MKITNLLFICLLLIFSICFTAYAQGGKTLDSAVISIRIKISPFFKVEIEPKEVLFRERDFFTALFNEEGKLMIEKKNIQNIYSASNIPYMLWISARDDYFTSSRGKIPVNQMEWRKKGEKTWIPMDTDPYLLLQRKIIGSTETQLDIRLVIDPYNIPPGNYSGEIIYTFTALENVN